MKNFHNENRPQEYLQSLDQAKSARKREKYANLFELSSDLSNGKFVKNISIYPSLQVTLVHPDMTREFENICKILYSERCPGMYIIRNSKKHILGTNCWILGFRLRGNGEREWKWKEMARALSKHFLLQLCKITSYCRELLQNVKMRHFLSKMPNRLSEEIIQSEVRL